MIFDYLYFCVDHQGATLDRVKNKTLFSLHFCAFFKMFFVSLGEKPLVFSFYKGVCTCKCKTNIVWFFLPFPNDLTKNTYGLPSHLSTYLTTYLPASENTLKEQC